jgi:hypothetical protein
MAQGCKKERNRRAWELAGSQHGIVTRQQLLALRFGSREIEHRVARGRLHLIMRGVYAVGWPELTAKRRWMAAVLACGDGAALSHHSAAALWGFGAEVRGQVELSVRRNVQIRRVGLRVHRRPALRASDITRRDGIPVTVPVRTLVDLGTNLGPMQMERAVNDADKRDVIDPEALRRQLDDYAGEPGVRSLRKVLDRRTFRLSDSALEVLFRPIAAAAGLPPPLTKQQVNGFEVDFYWPDLGLVVETDGLRYHRTPATQARDAERDRAHVIAGLSPLRFTHYEVKYEPAGVRGDLMRAAAMRAAR